jgi:hypothetical protein
MTVWVYRNGEIVEKRDLAEANDDRRSHLPSPMLSPRFETIESPVTGKAVSSWRDRDRDMRAADAVDPRDLPRKPFEERKEKYGRSRPDNDSQFEWRRPTEDEVTPRGRRGRV